MSFYCLVWASGASCGLLLLRVASAALHGLAGVFQRHQHREPSESAIRGALEGAWQGACSQNTIQNSILVAPEAHSTLKSSMYACFSLRPGAHCTLAHTAHSELRLLLLRAVDKAPWMKSQ